MSRRLPDRPNIRNLKNQAKGLLRSRQSGDLQAAERIKAYHPRMRRLSPEQILGHRFTLRSAQVVVAREYGFPSWPKLVAHVSAPDATEVGRAVSGFPICKGRQLVQAKIVDLFESNGSFDITLKCGQDDVVWIRVGRTEGIALDCALRGQPPPRPLPHNLIQDLLEKSGVEHQVQGVIIHGLEGTTFPTRLLMEMHGTRMEVDCRPSDGIVMATMREAPILVDSEVVQRAAKKERKVGSKEMKLAEVAARDRLKLQGPSAWVDLPYRYLKEHIVGPDGSTLRTFEAVTGVRVETDAMPKRLLLHSGDQDDLESAVELMRAVISDGRITPEAVEEIHSEAT